jgi:protein-tyrosine phosphatase
MTIQRNSKILYELVQAGALSQVTAMSITGEFGRGIQRVTRKLITKDLVHIIASDAHSKERRPPILSRAVREAAKIIGTDRAEMMVKEIPQAVLEGKMVE